MALGGSTNAVLHLIAMARAVDVPLTIDDFQKVSDRVPFIADLKPSGKYVMEDLHHVGGTPAVMKYLLEKGLLDGSCLTVTGKTIAENLADAAGPQPKASRSSTRSKSRSRRAGHIRILRGNFCPDGAVAKITGKEGLVFTGPARVLRQRRRHAARPGAEGDSKGRRDHHPLRRPARAAPACRRCSRRPRPSWAPASASDVALITDGRFSRRLARLHRRPRHARGPGRRPDRPGARRRPDHDRRRNEPDRRRRLRRRTRQAAKRPGKPRPTRPPAARSTSTSRT